MLLADYKQDVVTEWQKMTNKWSHVSLRKYIDNSWSYIQRFTMPLTHSFTLY